MKIVKSGDRGCRKGPGEWFTGDVWVDGIVEAAAPSRLQAARVTFSPGARTAWHTHPVVQVLEVVTGLGWVQLEGQAAQAIHPGDVVVIGAGENHWHGAQAGRTMVHLAMQQADDSGSTVAWGAKVTDEEYMVRRGDAEKSLVTARLVLRRWRESDKAPFRRLNADSRVTEFLRGPMDAVASDAMVERIEGHFEEHGFGLFAAEVRESGEFAGFIGLSVADFAAAFTPAVEIGWRLAAEQWGKGFATEGAREVLRYGFEEIGLNDVVSFTVPANARSRAVMERLGMVRDLTGDFVHPNVPEGDDLRTHVLYRLGREAWARGVTG